LLPQILAGVIRLDVHRGIRPFIATRDTIDRRIYRFRHSLTVALWEQRVISGIGFFEQFLEVQVRLIRRHAVQASALDTVTAIQPELGVDTIPAIDSVKLRIVQWDDIVPAPGHEGQFANRAVTGFRTLADTLRYRVFDLFH